MKDIKSIIVVGSSGSGKTTLVNSLRTPEYADRVFIPHRYITRPHRYGDDMVENSHLAHKVFMERVQAGLIWPFWNRTLDGGRVEQYGFEGGGDSNMFRVYSANNAFLFDQNSSVLSVLENSLIVVAVAKQEARDTRLHVRSPDMSSAERAVRLDDTGIDVLKLPVPVHVIDTTNFSPELGQYAFQKIVNSVLGSAKH